MENCTKRNEEISEILSNGDGENSAKYCDSMKEEILVNGNQAGEEHFENSQNEKILEKNSNLDHEDHQDNFKKGENLEKVINSDAYGGHLNKNIHYMDTESMASLSSEENDWEAYEKKYYGEEREFTTQPTNEDEDEDHGRSPEEKLNSKVMKLSCSDFADLHAMSDLGFRFAEKNCPKIIHDMFPALEIYFTVKSSILSSSSSSTPLPSSDTTNSSKTIQYFNPGDSPELTKMKLKHWAQTLVLSTLKRF